MPIHTGEGRLLSRTYQFKCSFHLETSLQTHPETMFSQISGAPHAPVRVTHKIDYHSESFGKAALIPGMSGFLSWNRGDFLLKEPCRASNASRLWEQRRKVNPRKVMGLDPSRTLSRDRGDQGLDLLTPKQYAHHPISLG